MTLGQPLDLDLVPDTSTAGAAERIERERAALAWIRFATDAEVPIAYVDCPTMPGVVARLSTLAGETSDFLAVESWLVSRGLAEPVGRRLVVPAQAIVDAALDLLALRGRRDLRAAPGLSQESRL